MMYRALALLIVPLLVGCATDSHQRKAPGPLYHACASGDLDACHEHATALEASDAEGRRAALVAYQYGCLLNHAASCNGLARMYGKTDASVSSRRVRAALESGCAGGEAEACVKLGDVSPRSRARDLYERACEQGSGQGCYKLANIVRRGWMLEENVRRALELQEQACDLGAVEGCVVAGQAYLFGSGVEADSERAFELLDPTCTDDVTEGCEILAKMYEEGIGVKADRAKATEYYDRGAKNPDGRVADSPASAYVVFVDACNHGNYLGCFAAGWFRAEGVEIERNITTSRELFQMACDNGVQTACERWKTIAPGGGVIVPAEDAEASAEKEAR